jgi:hydroxyacylglutathione hydrolase
MVLMILDKVVVGPLMVNCYVLGCKTTNKGIVVDPGEGAKLVLQTIEKNELNIEYILLTHGHIDHIGALPQIQKATGAQVYIHAKDQFLVDQAKTQAQMFGLPLPADCKIDEYFKDSDIIKVGNLEIKVISTPGHTPGSVSFLIENNLISGDTIFEASIGRTDFPGGSYPQIVNSIKNKIYALPDETIIHPGHGQSTTVEFEKNNNPFVHG